MDGEHFEGFLSLARSLRMVPPLHGKGSVVADADSIQMPQSGRLAHADLLNSNFKRAVCPPQYAALLSLVGSVLI